MYNLAPGFRLTESARQPKRTRWNQIMPTPFMHLEIAEQILAQPRLSDSIREQLTAAWPSFYLGSIAADFQTICNIPRDDTHFYPLPPDADDLAYPRMFNLYPELASAAALPLDRAVFVAGYCAHLLLDLRWFHQILMPFFVTNPLWGEADRRERFTSHNTLLTYMDREAFAGLPVSAEKTLRAAPTHNRAPFIPDDDLLVWRDMIADQLQPGSMTRTVAIFAERLGMTPTTFAANLDNPDWMQTEVFDRVPFDKVRDVFAVGLEDSVTLVTDYLENNLH
jgi:hypothetical protein